LKNTASDARWSHSQRFKFHHVGFINMYILVVHIDREKTRQKVIQRKKYEHVRNLKVDRKLNASLHRGRNGKKM